MGMSGEQSALTSQALFQLLNMLAVKIAPPSQATPAAVASGSQQAAAVREVVHVDDEKPQEQRGDDMEFTEGSTDTAAETAAANNKQPYQKIKKKLNKKERDAKSGKGAPQGKGSTKSTDKEPNKVVKK